MKSRVLDVVVFEKALSKFSRDRVIIEIPAALRRRVRVGQRYVVVLIPVDSER